jgi:cellobiose phosphorylase
VIAEGLKEHAVIANDMSERRIVHGWGDRQTYYVGGFKDPDGVARHGLTSNAFWVISGMYENDSEMKEIILNAFDNLDSRFGLKTFEPHFLPNTPGVGRIYKLPPGTAENGAAYIHATAFGIMALFMMGEAEKAWDQLMKIFPFTHDHISCSPYVMPNSYGDNKALNIDGESMQDWQTGSSNVVLKIILRFVFGFQPEYDGFYIQPAAWFPFETYQLDMIYQESILHISYNNKKTGRRRFMVNNKTCPPIHDAYINADKLWISRHEIGKVVDIAIED